jgi:hypothetical protein
VGSLPTTDGTAATAQAGCLLVLDNHGNVAETFYGSLINGPWDMTAWDVGQHGRFVRHQCPERNCSRRGQGCAQRNRGPADP